MTLLVTNGTMHWLNISDLFFKKKKNIKVKGCQCPD